MAAHSVANNTNTDHKKNLFRPQSDLSTSFFSHTLDMKNSRMRGRHFSRRTVSEVCSSEGTTSLLWTMLLTSWHYRFKNSLVTWWLWPYLPGQVTHRFLLSSLSVISQVNLICITKSLDDPGLNIQVYHCLAYFKNIDEFNSSSKQCSKWLGWR